MSLKNLNLRGSSSTRKRRPRWPLAILVIVLLALFFPLQGAYSGFQELKAHGQAIGSAYQNQNFGQLQAEISGSHKSLQKIDTSLGFLFWLKAIPIIGGYYGDVKALTYGAARDLQALDKLFTELKPSEKELGFLGTPLAGQDRISQMLKILDKSLPILPSLNNDFKAAKESVDGIDENKYPEDFRGVKVRAAMRTAKNFMVGTYLATSEHVDALKITPSALGIPPKNYLLLFQNDKEIRPTGGFMTAYAFLKVDRGQLSTTVSDDIYRLDEHLLATCQSKICPLTPPSPIVRYLPEVNGKSRSAWSMRDSNLSPNVPTSAKEFERMYTLLGQGLPFDGIIYIDTQVVEEMIEVTGPIEVYGTKYTAETDHRCNCPNVIFELESYAEIAAKGEQDRKAVLGVLMSQILAKAIGSDIEKLPQLVETVTRLANHKHIMFFMHDSTTQEALAKLNWIGEIKTYDGDYLHINDANFAGGKSNIYVEQTVTQEINVKGGKVTKKITVEYKNPQPFGTWLNGINRDYVRVYVPMGSKLTGNKGSDDPVNTLEDLGKTVFEGFVQIRPQNSRKLELEYEVPYEPKREYKIMVQKQPGAKDFHYIIKINGSTKADFKLDSDKEFTFDL